MCIIFIQLHSEHLAVRCARSVWCIHIRPVNIQVLMYPSQVCYSQAGINTNIKIFEVIGISYAKFTVKFPILLLQWRFQIMEKIILFFSEISFVYLSSRFIMTWWKNHVEHHEWHQSVHFLLVYIALGEFIPIPQHRSSGR